MALKLFFLQDKGFLDYMSCRLVLEANYIKWLGNSGQYLFEKMLERTKDLQARFEHVTVNLEHGFVYKRLSAFSPYSWFEENLSATSTSLRVYTRRRSSSSRLAA